MKISHSINVKLVTVFILTSLIFVSFSQEVGSKAPDISAADINGNTIKLSDLGGKVILIDFWASWCVPCKKSMPHLIETYNRLKDSNFTVIAVNLDTDKEKIFEFQKNNELEIPFAIIFDKNSKLPSIYNVEGMPTTVIIDKQGTIRYKEVGYDNEIKEKIDKTINKLLY